MKYLTEKDNTLANKNENNRSTWNAFRNIFCPFTSEVGNCSPSSMQCRDGCIEMITEPELWKEGYRKKPPRACLAYLCGRSLCRGGRRCRRERWAVGPAGARSGRPAAAASMAVGGLKAVAGWALPGAFQPFLYLSSRRILTENKHGLRWKERTVLNEISFDYSSKIELSGWQAVLGSALMGKQRLFVKFGQQITWKIIHTLYLSVIVSRSLYLLWIISILFSHVLGKLVNILS